LWCAIKILITYLESGRKFIYDTIIKLKNTNLVLHSVIESIKTGRNEPSIMVFHVKIIIILFMYTCELQGFSCNLIIISYNLIIISYNLVHIHVTENIYDKETKYKNIETFILKIFITNCLHQKLLHMIEIRSTIRCAYFNTAFPYFITEFQIRSAIFWFDKAFPFRENLFNGIQLWGIWG